VSGDREDTAGVEDYDDFFRSVFPCLVKHLIRMGYDWEAANDAAEDGMLAVYKAVYVERKDVPSPQAYARKAAVHAAYNQARRDRERVERSIRGGWLLPDHVDPIAALDDRLDSAATLQTLMAKLPNQQRTVLALHLDGFTNTEIAHELDKLRSTIGSTLRHAKERLRSELGPIDRRRTERSRNESRQAETPMQGPTRPAIDGGDSREAS
jgi:RNA polymerase sigma-70 factor (ECF subfamily)